MVDTIFGITALIVGIITLLISSVIFWLIGNLIIYVFTIDYTWTILHGLVVAIIYRIIKRLLT